MDADHFPIFGFIPTGCFLIAFLRVMIVRFSESGFANTLFALGNRRGFDNVLVFTGRFTLCVGLAFAGLFDMFNRSATV